MMTDESPSKNERQKGPGTLPKGSVAHLTTEPQLRSDELLFFAFLRTNSRTRNH
jgi:hypothetical protein